MRRCGRCRALLDGRVTLVAYELEGGWLEDVEEKPEQTFFYPRLVEGSGTWAAWAGQRDNRAPATLFLFSTGGLRGH